jgi:hypothetical protein
VLVKLPSLATSGANTIGVENDDIGAESWVSALDSQMRMCGYSAKGILYGAQ